MKRNDGFTLISFICIVAGLFLGFLFTGAVVAKGAELAGTPSWFEHVDFMNVLIGSLLVLLTGFTIRLIKKYDKNQDIMFNRLENLCKEFYTLQGEHNAMKDIHNGIHSGGRGK